MTSIAFNERKMAKRSAKTTNINILISLSMRTILFFIVGALFVGIFALLGSEQPLKDAEKWWLFKRSSRILLHFLWLKTIISG